MSWFSEIRRRNVLRAGFAYAVVWWLLVQVGGLLLDAFDAPGWIFRGLIILLATGFPVALILAWFFELTPSGLVRNEDLPMDDAQARFIRAYLNPIVISMLTAAVILFALDKFVWTGEATTGTAAGDVSDTVPSDLLAVLPFSNRSSRAEDVYFVDGIHDDLLTMLAKIDALRVVSRTSVMRYRNTEKSIPEISRELGVGYVLEGGVQRAGEHVRINAQLIDATADEHLWAETFDRELTTENLFTIQSDIARAIANALNTQLTADDEQRLEEIPTENLAAYEAYLLGRQYLLGNRIESYREALVQFERAASLDEAFAEARAGICESHLKWYSRSSEVEHYFAAETACREAIEIGGERPEVHVVLGALYRHHGDYERAEREQRLALEAEPQNVEALIELGETLALQGDIRSAETNLKRAASLQPDHWPAHDALSGFYRNYDDRPGRFERAVHSAMRVVELTPESASAWNNLGVAYHSLQQYDAAKAAWDRALELEPSRSAFTNRGLQYYYDGRYSDAVEMQLKATELAPSDHRAWGRLAESYRLLGGHQKEAQRAYETATGLAESRLEINAQDWRTRGLLATYYAHLGRAEQAAMEIEAALEQSGRDPEALLYAALIAHQAGETEVALAALEEMVEGNAAFRMYAAEDPDLRSLAGNERFDRIIEP